MTTTTPRHSQWASRYLGRPIRDQLIAEGLIVEHEERLTHVRHNRPVLRMDAAGRAEAERACRDRRVLSGMPGMDAVLQRRPLFGRRPTP